jgi:peptidoglycan/LPS O-acetylase OafA/YrhL
MRILRATRNAGADAGDFDRKTQLDGLRALAVTAVLWAHWVPIESHLAGFGFGELGVNLFFVLSGYLITGILVDATSADSSNRKSVLFSFYARRFLRLFPLYYAFLILLVVLGIPPYREAWLWHAGYLQNFYQQWHGRDMWGSHLWTLAIEEQFYLLWPILILFLGPKLIVPLLGLLVVAAPVSRWLVWTNGWNWDPNLFPLGANDCLGMGSLLAILQHRVSHSLIVQMLRWVAIVGVVGIALSLAVDALEIKALRQTFSAMVFAFVVWHAARGFRGPLGRMLEWRPAVYLGRISYGVYLIHGFAPALWLWFYYSCPVPGYRILTRFGITGEPHQSVWMMIIINSVITFSIACLSWHFFEGPLNRLKRHFPYGRPLPCSGT